MRPERKRRWDRDNYIRGMRPSGRAGHLSPQEVADIYNLLDQGYSYRRVADEVGVCFSTVKYHAKKKPPTFADEGLLEERSEQIRADH